MDLLLVSPDGWLYSLQFKTMDGLGGVASE